MGSQAFQKGQTRSAGGGCAEHELCNPPCFRRLQGLPCHLRLHCGLQASAGSASGALMICIQFLPRAFAQIMWVFCILNSWLYKALLMSHA